MIFFVLLANMECCYQSVKILEEMIHSKYQRATPEFPVFFILRCLKLMLIDELSHATVSMCIN